MNAVGGSFEPNSEVDSMAWVRPTEAVLRLSHDHDIELLTAVTPQLEAVLDQRDRAETLSLG
jgi:hypothetical protein